MNADHPANPVAVLAALGPLVVTLDEAYRVAWQSRGDRFILGDSWCTQASAASAHVAAVQATLSDGEAREFQLGLERVRVTRVDARSLALLIEPLRSESSLERRMQMALDASGMGLWRWDPHSGEADWDDNMRALTGHPTPLPFDQFLEILVDPSEWESLRGLSADLVPGDQPPLYTRIRRFNDGEERWLLTVFTVLTRADGTPGERLGGSIDITERQKMLEELATAKRMEAMAHVTAGVAHNFNNMLMIVEPCLQELAAAAPANREASHDALEATRRAAEVVRQLMLLVKGETGERVPISVAALCQRSFDLARRATPDPVRMDLAIDAVGRVLALEGALEQVLDNLLSNARDAALASDHPHVSVTVKEVDFGGEAWAQIVVADSGAGIPEEHRERLFVPFHTTKGNGTGLGLATSQRLIADYGGQLAYRRTDERTEFLVLVPLHTGRVSVTPLADPEPRNANGRRRVLIVDDEPAIRRLLVRGLTRFGDFDVEAVGSARELRDTLSQGGTFDAVLLDRSLGDGDGCELAPSVRAAYPNALILLFTGEPLTGDFECVDQVLHKPMPVRRVAEALRTAPSPSRDAGA